MSQSASIFIADSCIGGLSVLQSLWRSGRASQAVFLADYQCNPLGVKNEHEIAEVTERWITTASTYGNFLLIACNTLSVRYHFLRQSENLLPQIDRVLSMVDCFAAMVSAEKKTLTGKNVLVIGTQYTASQNVYPDILVANVPGVTASTIAATELERRIARLESWDAQDTAVLTTELREAIAQADIAVLACTCFPMASDKLEAEFPEVVFLDPGEYCASLLQETETKAAQELRLSVTGNIVGTADATDFARSYLSSGSVNE